MAHILRTVSARRDRRAARPIAVRQRYGRGVKRTLLAALVLALIVPATAGAAPRPGAAGIGDPYFPKDGNGGYDVAHYGLELAYTPKTRPCCAGVATITAKATQDLSSFNLDLGGLNVRSVKVGGRAATWRRKRRRADDHPAREPAPRRALHDRDRLRRQAGPGRRGRSATAASCPPTTARWSRASRTAPSTWYPANEHPRDKAAYSFRISVPRGLEAIANGVLVGVDDARAAARSGAGRRRSRWRRTWRRPRSGSSTSRRVPVDGHPVLGRDRPRPAERPKPRTGARYAVTGIAQPAYKRLHAHDRRPRGRREAVVLRQPRHRAGRRLLLRRGAHRGADDWTTLRDKRGHTAATPAFDCARAAEGAPVPRALPDARGERRLRTERHDRQLVGGERRRATATSAGRRPRALRGPQRRGLADLRQRRRLPVQRRRRRRRRRRRARGLDVVRGRRRHARRLDGPGRARRQRAEHGRLERGDGRARAAARRATSPRRRSPASRR